MPLPNFVHGFLPPRPEPYDATLAEVKAVFCGSEERSRAWQGFRRAHEMLTELLPLDGCHWWLHGEFVTAASFADQVVAQLVMPWPEDEDAFSGGQRLLLQIATDGQSFQTALHTRLQALRMSDESTVKRERQRCARNRLHEGDELQDAGWVRLS